eukprot:1267711-Rhodomonas_salina.2
MSGTAYVRAKRDAVLNWRMVLLHACYAMFGTKLAYDASGLRACYAMSGTKLAYGACCLRGAMRCPAYGAIAAYARAMRCPFAFLYWIPCCRNLHVALHCEIFRPHTTRCENVAVRP